MNTDMSVFKVHGQCSWLHGQCSWSTWSVFMVHVVSVHGLRVSVHFNMI